MLNNLSTGEPAADNSVPTNTDVVITGFYAVTSELENNSPSAF